MLSSHKLIRRTLFTVITLFHFTLYSQNTTPKFEHVPFDEGFSKKSILCSYQDSHGFMWFCTKHGLYRYDGYDFIVYQPHVDDPYSISSGYINKIFEDSRGTLWIGTNDAGLNRYDRNLDRFIRYLHDPDDPHSIGDNTLYAICEGDSGTLWIGTLNGGLNRFNPETERFTRYIHDPEDKHSLSYNDVRFLQMSDSGLLWLGTEQGGVNSFHPETEKFTLYTQDGKISREQKDNPFVPSDQYRTTALFEDHDGQIWFAIKYGIVRLDPVTGMAVRFDKTRSKFNALGENTIWAICRDRSGAYWFGGTESLFQYNPQTDELSRYRHDPVNPNSLVWHAVISIYEDRTGVLWFGTWEGGLCKYDPGTARFGHVQTPLSDGYVNAIYEDSRKQIWIGTSEGGLSQLKSGNPSAGGPRFIHYRHDPHNSNSLISNCISDICEDSTGLLWIATKKRGLNVLDPLTGRFTRFPFERYGIQALNLSVVHIDLYGFIWMGREFGFLHRYSPKTDSMRTLTCYSQHSGDLVCFGISCFYEDRTGSFWIGTQDGLTNLIFPEGEQNDWSLKKTIHYQMDPKNRNSLSNNSIRTVFEDRAGHIWIGTSMGLNRLDGDRQTIARYYKEDGLPSNVINGIAEDEKQRLWISTNNGLSHFDPLTDTFRNFDIRDGLQGNDFRVGAVCTASDGKLYFGGSNGYNAFLPDHTEDSPPPPLAITGFNVLNRPVGIGEVIEGQKVLTSAITMTDQVTLSYKSRVFSFDYAALDFRASEKNRYAYILEGFEEEWIDAGMRRHAVYTNLKGGHYTFRVKAANKDGIWNEQGATIRINITPPWWKRLWARILFALAGFTLLFFIARFWLHKERMKTQLDRERLESEKFKELDILKSRFFANISHEFRTPLTLILGTARQIMDYSGDETVQKKSRLQMKNGRRLLHLINELLDLSKLDAGRMHLEVREQDILPLVRGICHSFESYAMQHDITLSVTSQVAEAPIYFDHEKMEQIVSNLISNAVKFTPAKGRIEVSVSRNDSLEIRVADTGPGIGEAHLPHVFDRFFEAGSGYAKDQKSSGIGLALTRELVKLHHGEIDVKSLEGEGSTFIVKLPLGRAHLSDEEIIDEASATTTLPYVPSLEPVPILMKEGTAVQETPLLLIVEDNADMRVYMREVLTGGYEIIEAEDGQAGFDLAAERIPDLVISDVMMPRMDGYQLCEIMKTDERTSHIPVVLLTARSDSESKMEGLTLGADDYLTKPFDSDELKVRVRNLIDQRCRLRKRFSKEITMPLSDIAIMPADEKFLGRAAEIIESRLTDPDLSIEWFSREMGLSRSQLYRKLQALVNQSASEFIRSIRLKRTVHLLDHRAGTVSEIAFEAGFNSPEYFRACFKEQFGCSPTEYQSRP
ncbi:response regulator [bacterium]|nr:response regulator [bacterium]